ncbi:sporulation/spore germination protein [Rivularia sp. PCC 7116]|uniref:GerMN domain-containing protein n=1 Tax=Rivularia sp. PCC 7116 TaxID=373994 RepID=UPI00029EEDC5|nr:GerMN domain-containing protein [Rivularia sp. PCC 7116]AFY55495.1 sporulation/spore germination protein [Rivularia sp. PCC 7116]
MKTQNTRPVQQNIFIIYILSLLSLVITVVWLNGIGLNNNSTTIKTTPTSTPEQIKKSPISTENNTVPKPNIPFILPKPVEKLTPKEKTPSIQLQPKAYLLQVEGEKVSLVPQAVAIKKGVSKEVALQQTLNQLFDNNQNNQFTSTIPQGTKLLGLRIDDTTGIHVNLSDEFRYGGGSTSMIYRVAQVLYTASSIDESANIYLSIEGELLDEENPLGGEGLILAEPLTRQKFIKDFSIN